MLERPTSDRCFWCGGEPQPTDILHDVGGYDLCRPCASALLTFAEHFMVRPDRPSPAGAPVPDAPTPPTHRADPA